MLRRQTTTSGSGSGSWGLLTCRAVVFGFRSCPADLPSAAAGSGRTLYALPSTFASVLTSPHCCRPLGTRRFGFGLGMTLVAKSDQSTSNHHFASYVMQSGQWAACHR